VHQPRLDLALSIDATLLSGSVPTVHATPAMVRRSGALANSVDDCTPAEASCLIVGLGLPKQRIRKANVDLVAGRIIPFDVVLFVSQELVDSLVGNPDGVQQSRVIRFELGNKVAGSEP
jgi:hypothetical protein